MSGIVALQGDLKDSEKLETMLSKLEHRGPDARETYTMADSFLGQVKSQGEPSFTKKRAATLVLDGQPSYLGKQISREELLNLYLEKGTKFIKQLGDAFTFILSDGDELVAARDTFGARPLYYVNCENGLMFASEIKALEELNPDAEIKIFPPGTYYSSTEGFSTFKKIPGFQANIHASPGSQRYNQKAEELNRLLIEAVRKNVTDQENIGVFLSGGVDSSIIAAALDKITDKPIKTFAVGVAGSDDVMKARKVAEFLNSEHKEYTYDYDDMMKVLPEVIYYLESFDVELVNSSIANFLVAYLAKESGMEVVLSGEGADELFGGYHHLKDCSTDSELNRELEHLLKGLHNGGLQRVDRMTKAHALDCRMPFFDKDVIDFARVIPCNWKITDEGMEKLILRQAFDGMLPEEVLWRKKVQFGIGSGNEGVMEEKIKNQITDKEYRNAQKNTSFTFKSKIEYYYYKIFKEKHPLKGIESTVNRWLA
ncbi:asparagine synthase-related protein [Natranaerobius thermophilus]|uniref:asparagine synthase (glutamine-hydrolyzing) n=1 Tax=Natranaerobius thermophilus (strain ATCC BAA-1301 / DSM 18059 / JW/NM-WN-LF) TaxID=457570 RepID=B2A5U7_NATTJ|nr:asparagine synthase-related protein [Natranaerobius thermophilus]ACB84040.1 asparagine synthase [Natranaerobius thermophilus JW/NM-WN-LF]